MRIGETHNFSWTHPTTRTSGLPLDPTAIAATEIWQSVDDGATFQLLVTVPAPAISKTQQILASGNLQFKARTRLTDGQGSAYSNVISLSVDPDNSSPSPPTNFQ